ncbi:uncharacterized protein LOC144881063 isoform X2 [Branchiostoma floridae x Branchiostoma japonicum]
MAGAVLLRSGKQTSLAGSYLGRTQDFRDRKMPGVLLLLMTTVAAALPLQHTPCPDACTCTGNNKKIDCSNAQLLRVPSEIPQQVSQLSLNGNTLLNVSNGSFSKYKQLTHLMLAHNGLREVGPGTFTWQEKLLSLNLSHNSLSVMDADMFTGLSHLVVLDASDNEIREIKDNLCLAMPKLQALYLGGNKLSVIPGGLNHCAFLKQLHLQNNSIGSVNTAGLQNLSQLTHLELQNNTISEVPPRSLKFLSNLTHLSLAGNKISKIGGKSLKGLVSLRVLDLSNNKIKRITPKAFKHTKQLEKLFLNNNQYRKLSKNVFPPTLKALHFKGNKLTELSRKPFRTLRGLEVLELSDNKIKHVKSNTFNSLRGLVSLSLAGNQLRAVPEAFQYLNSTQRLIMKENPLRTVPAYSFANLASLLNLDLSKCNISQIHQSAFVGLELLETLSLKQNIIEHFPKAIFNFSTTLQKLDVSGNNLDSFCPSQHGTTTLKSLSMGHNPISNIPKACFNNQQSLTKLSIQGAKLVTIEEGAFKGLKKLRFLTLKNNKLKTLPKNVFDPLSKECRLNLAGNPWSCDCRMYDFKKWLKKNEDKAHFGNSLRCYIKSKKRHKKITALRKQQFECEKPSITDKSQEYVYLPQGKEALFKCVATGLPEPTITWFRNDEQVSNISSLAGRIAFLSEHPSHGTFTQSVMTLANINSADSGQYSCVATNEQGQVTETFTLDVANPMEKPEQLIESPMPYSSTSPAPLTTKMPQKTAPFLPPIDTRVPYIPHLEKPLAASTGTDEPGSQERLSQPMIILIAMVAAIMIAIIVLTVFVIKLWQKKGGKKGENAPEWLKGAKGHDQLSENEAWMRAINKNYVKLVDNMRAKDLMKWLIQDGILTQEMQDEVKHEGTKHDQNVKLLMFIRGEEAVKCLCHALKQNGNNDLATCLEVQLMPKTPDQV